MSQKASYCFYFKQHLRAKQAFNRVISQGYRCRVNSLSIFAIPNDLHYSRLGIILSKKQVKRSVDRSYIKRLLRERFRLSQVELKNYDLVIIGYSGLVDMTKPELRKLVASLWEKLYSSQKKSALR